MTNPYSAQAPSPVAPEDRLPKFKFEKVGDGVQGVIIRQSNWMQDTYNKENQIRYIDLETPNGGVTVVVKSYNQKRAIGDVLTEKNLTDTAVGDQFGMQFINTVDTGKGNPAKIFKAFVNRP